MDVIVIFKPLNFNTISTVSKILIAYVQRLLEQARTAYGDAHGLVVLIYE